jgi:hypothetical protein
VSDTKSIAASVISEMSSADSSPDLAPSNEGTNALADVNPQVIRDEVAHLTDFDPSSDTRRTAAVFTSAKDPRNWTLTDSGMLRRETHYAPGSTEAIARELIDLQDSQAGRAVPDKDRTAIAAQRWAAEHNAVPEQDDAMPIGMEIAPTGSDEWYAAADAIVDRIAKRSRFLR